MPVRVSHLGRVVFGLVVVGLVVGALSVEAVTRSEVSRAQHALPDALARAIAPDDAGRAAVEQLTAARRHFRLRDSEAAAEALESILKDTPTADLHDTASMAWYAAGDGQAAARHAQLAARLAPDNEELAGKAEHAIDMALAWKVRPASRPLGVIGAFALLALFISAGARGHRRRKLEDFLDAVRGRVVFHTDAGQFAGVAPLDARTEDLTVDVFLSGRYGMACPRRPEHAPTLRLAFSHAATSKTVRLRPIQGVRDSAVRIPIRKETLRTLLAQEGRWRLHVRLASRPIATAEVDVARAGAPAPLRGAYAAS